MPWFHPFKELAEGFGGVALQGETNSRMISALGQKPT